MFWQNFMKITKKTQKKQNLYKTNIKLVKTINFHIEFCFQLIFSNLQYFGIILSILDKILSIY